MTDKTGGVNTLSHAVPAEEKERLVTLVRMRQRFHEFLHEITFTTLAEYLYILQELTCNVLSGQGSRAMLYLAAAVSDFYIPRQEMVSLRATSSVVDTRLSF